MTIRNQAGIFDNQLRPKKGVAGAPASPSGLARPFLLAVSAQSSTLTFAGTASDGDYVSNFELPSGEVVSVTTTRDTTPAANADLAAQHVLDIAATTKLVNVVKATDSGGGVVALAFIHPGFDYPITASAPGTGTLTPALVSAAGGVSLPVGTFVKAGAATASGEATVAALESGDSESAIIGMIVRPLGRIPNAGGQLNADLDEEIAPSTVDVAFTGEWYVDVIDSAAANYGAAVHVVKNAAGGDQVGGVRTTADGGNTVQLGSDRAYFAEPVVANGTDVGTVLLRL